MRKINNILAVIPTYNERENVENIITRVLAADPRLTILIIDDNSPDGTGEIVKSIMEDEPRVRLLERPGKQGLGTAYVAGFKVALKDRFDGVVQIDADLSHNPDDICHLIRYAEEGADFVIGSRYVSGVNVINWPLQRLLLSYFASVYSRLVTGMPFKDLTAGFSLVRREVLETIDFAKIRSNGYSFQIELKFHAWSRHFRIRECPIVFVERAEGHSKMNKRIVLEAIFMVWKLRIGALLGKK